MPMVSIPQGGEKAEAIKKTLAGIKLPPGFKISLYALVPDARMIAVGPAGCRDLRFDPQEQDLHTSPIAAIPARRTTYASSPRP